MKDLAYWKAALIDLQEMQAANKVLIRQYSRWWVKWLRKLDVACLKIYGKELKKAEELALKRIHNIESNVFKIGSFE